MIKINNKGFTLIELLMTIVLLAVVVAIASPFAFNALQGGQQKSYDILVDNILTASKLYYEECKYNDLCTIDTDNSVTITLQELVDYGFLTTDVDCDNKTNCDSKVLENPKDKVNIGYCQIKITRSIDSNTRVSYNVISITNSGSCPINDDTGELGSVS